RSRIERADAALSALPARILGNLQGERQRVSSMMRQGDTAISHALVRGRALLAGQDRVLQSLSYKNVLKRGYAVVRDADDKPLTRAAAVTSGQPLSIEFSDGRVGAAAGAMPEGPAMPPVTPASGRKKPAAKAERATDPPRQGGLS